MTDMKVDKVVTIKVDKVADMKVDMVANREVDKVADIDVNMGSGGLGGHPRSQGPTGP